MTLSLRTHWNCRKANTVGVLWLNAAETWVDVDRGDGANIVDSIVNLVGGNLIAVVVQ